ncbi:DUF3499 family protein [Kocuria massiliensis]|uniref:DUF3499 family protein n=1 Tax=Kocuria massiliensis TaxID=1926282 RepID=UPI000A1CA3BF|nr:DUF3499 family protein [Kocuria massiliensis]
MTENFRMCSRMMCQREATYTLTYAYSESTVVIGPLATRVEPHAYDMCATHAMRLTAPRGWDIVRLDIDDSPQSSMGDEAHPSVGSTMGEDHPDIPDNVRTLHFMRGLDPRA